MPSSEGPQSTPVKAAADTSAAPVAVPTHGAPAIFARFGNAGVVERARTLGWTPSSSRHLRENEGPLRFQSGERVTDANLSAWALRQWVLRKTSASKLEDAALWVEEAAFVKGHWQVWLERRGARGDRRGGA